MMISSVKNDVGCRFKDKDINGHSGLYSEQEDKDSHVRHVVDVLLETGKITPQTYERLRCKSADTTVGSSDTETLLLQAKLCSKDDIIMAKAKL